MLLPPESTMTSLARPTMYKRPSLVEAAEVSGVKPSVVQHLVGRGLVAIVALPSRWVRARPSRRSSQSRASALSSTPFERPSDRPDLHRLAGPRDLTERARPRSRPYPSSSGIPMSLKNSATRWGRAEPPLTASRSRPPSAEWTWRNTIEPKLRPESRRGGDSDRADWSKAAWKNGPRASTSSTMRRWTASHTAGTPISAVGPNVGKRARQGFRVDFERIDDRRAARERQQHPAGEFEGVMQRQQ